MDPAGYSSALCSPCCPEPFALLTLFLVWSKHLITMLLVCLLRGTPVWNPYASWTQGFIVCIQLGKVFLQVFFGPPFSWGTPVAGLPGDLKPHLSLVSCLCFVLGSSCCCPSRSLAISSVMAVSLWSVCCSGSWTLGLQCWPLLGSRALAQ